ncbi:MULTISPECIES: PH-like domain-containing protein [unclassified Pseudoclavibacter]|uniref:PH-like domain-containing protein n=1 Tax=unclassified Pseudoclavibacter TaxID=2615177 RepID=UPI0012F26D31|nr:MULTISPECIES: hypothetical protein [unclassified Pseudoclavibacter]MBF4459328.1 hypothetical protein [Pseudoclavibacter sp. VKM Ac-2867]VXB23084.1 conserved hypothetical protein [Pseudoclavibacter sp. 8L]
MDDRVLPATLTIVAFLIIVVLMWLGWRRRVRGQAGISTPLEAPHSTQQPLGHWHDVHYVSTSRTGDALDRIVVPPLGFRGRAEVTVLREGPVVQIAGERAFFIPAGDIEATIDGTVTIDRVVENGGLTIIRWLLPADEHANPRVSVETSLRVVDATAREQLKTALHSLQLTPAPTTEESS